jgi:hypothetical protein
MATRYSTTLVKAFCMERQFKARTERHRHLWRRRSFELTVRAPAHQHTRGSLGGSRPDQAVAVCVEKARRRGASNIRVGLGANERPSTRFLLFL